MREVLDDRLLDRRAVPLLHPERSGDGVGHGAAVAERGQLAEPRAIGEPGLLPGGHFDGQPGLADPTDPGQRHERGRPQRTGDRGDGALTPDERRTPPRQVAHRRARGRRQGRVLLQHPAVHLARGVGRLDAELVDQPAPQRPVDAEGVGLAAARVQRAHQQGGHGLAIRMPFEQALHLGDDLAAAAQRQHRLGPFLRRGQAQVGQAGEVPVEVDVGGVELDQRLAAPQGQRGVQQVERLDVVGDPRTLAGQPEQAGERGRIQLVPGDVEEVAGRPPAQPLPRQRDP